MSKITVITSKTIELNEYVHYFEMKMIELYAVRMMISGIVVEIDG